MFSGGVRLYRLWLRRGEPFALQMKGNPPVEHDGGTTVVHLALTAEQAEILKGVAVEHGVDCDLITHERQTPEQSKERQTLLGMQRGERAWPSGSCPSCPWFDPLLEADPCGRVGWPPESIAAFGEGAHPQQALSKCPVPHVWDKVGCGGI